MSRGLIYGAVMALFAVVVVGSALCLRASPASRTDVRPAMGANVADLKNIAYLDDLEFRWMKGFVSWDRIERYPGIYDWTDIDKLWPVLARHPEVRVLLRVDRVPAWARPSNDHPNAPPDPEFRDAWARFLTDLARRTAGRIDAYEVWNEPNLTVEWGGLPADPEAYVELLAVSYPALKRGNQQATIVGMSLAPTAGTPGGAMDTLVFANRAYAAGAGRWFDVYGVHPYGFGFEPAFDGRYAFRGAEYERAIMEAWGDGAKAMWATEWGWQLSPAVEGRVDCLSTDGWQGALYVEEATAARWLPEARDYAAANWPWMEVMFLFNLDFSMAPWYEDRCEPMLYHALLNRDGSPRATYRALRPPPLAGSTTTR